MFDKIKWFKKAEAVPIVEKETPFSEENYKRELESFLFKRIDNKQLTEVGRESLIEDINEHISNGVTKEDIFNDLKKLSRDSFMSKYEIDRRTVDQKVSDEINTVTLRISETLRSKNFTESAVEMLFKRAQNEIIDDAEAFERKLEKMSADEINETYFK
jgi:DNA repair exonuclease SbcCD nuclease subunit